MSDIREETYQPAFAGTYIGEAAPMTCREVCRLLGEIVRIPSVTGQEEALGRYLTALGRREGLTVEVMPCREEGRFNVIWSLGCRSYREGDYGLMLHGHYDTVPVMDMADPYETAVIDGHRMRGRGIVDQKAGLAASLAAMIALKRAGVRLTKPLMTACVIDEESEHSGSYTLAESGIRADYAISTEPTGGRCAFGCKGTTPLCLVVKGRTAHAGMPWKGINAIEKALPLLERLFRARFARVDLGPLGIYEGTLCVSKMAAGTAYTNVPGEAVIWMDRRTVPGETTALALREIEAIIDEARRDDPALEAAVMTARPDWHWEPIIRRGLEPTLTDLDTPLYTYLNEAAVSLGLAPVEKEFWTGYTDMDFLVNDMGIPTLVFGPGDNSLCHTAEEIIELDEVCRSAEIFCRTAIAACGLAGDEAGRADSQAAVHEQDRKGKEQL